MPAKTTGSIASTTALNMQKIIQPLAGTIGSAAHGREVFVDGGTAQI
jgi:hypothetical protein